MPHWAALSVSLILVLHILLGKAILEYEEIHISINANSKFAYESKCCKCKLLVRYENLCISMWNMYR